MYHSTLGLKVINKKKTGGVSESREVLERPPTPNMREAQTVFAGEGGDVQSARGGGGGLTATLV